MRIMSYNGMASVKEMRNLGSIPSMGMMFPSFSKQPDLL